ncbi:hypothetical protein TEQG_02882 [Trichophyton equinum CBS 127.97]|nr:hypothetical protein TEQG_02882 [Trichophyton equinum CBS 127.97]
MPPQQGEFRAQRPPCRQEEKKGNRRYLVWAVVSVSGEGCLSARNDAALLVVEVGEVEGEKKQKKVEVDDEEKRKKKKGKTQGPPSYSALGKDRRDEAAGVGET